MDILVNVCTVAHGPATTMRREDLETLPGGEENLRIPLEPAAKQTHGSVERTRESDAHDTRSFGV